jgi:hypothetical protein
MMHDRLIQISGSSHDKVDAVPARDPSSVATTRRVTTLLLRMVTFLSTIGPLLSTDHHPSDVYPYPTNSGLTRVIPKCSFYPQSRLEPRLILS